MSNPRIREALLRVGGAFVLANVLLIYVPTSALSLIAIAAVFAGSVFLDYRKLLPLAFSLALVTGLLELVVRFGGLGVTPYFRPHEVLALDKSYQPNRSIQMTVPHGDLLTVNPTLPRNLGIERREAMVTDSSGHPNERSYSGQRLIMVGDSFLVGTETTLTQRLQERHGIQAYNASFSGSGPLVYAEKVTWARETLSKDSCIAVFYFEGNDFRTTNAADLATRDAVPTGMQEVARGYTRLIRGNSEWSKVFSGLLTRSHEIFRQRGMSWGSSAPPAAETTLTRSVGGQPMVFLRGYAEVVRRRSFDDNGFIKSRLAAARPDLVVFIPDKFRVYASLVDDSPETDLPHAQWQFLKDAADELQIEAVDLSQPMVDQSRELLAVGRTSFWRDDTHWNRFGEDIAADVLKDVLAASTTPSCQASIR